MEVAFLGLLLSILSIRSYKSAYTLHICLNHKCIHNCAWSAAIYDHDIFLTKYYQLEQFFAVNHAHNTITFCSVEMLVTIHKLYSSRYTFGEAVNGIVTLNFTLEASGRRESLMFKQIVKSLQVSNGKNNWNV